MIVYQEKDNVELKRELTDAVKKEIVAFLNTMNGTILIGVEDDGGVYWPFQEEDRDYIDTKVANWLQDSIYPLPIDFRSFKRNCFLSGSIIKRNDFKCFCARRLFHQIKY